MRVFLQCATDNSVRIHRAIKARMQCLFCRQPTVIGSHYVALRGVTEDRAPCTSYFHVGCFGACMELTENGENLVDSEGWDADEVRAVTPDIYEIAQFLAIHSAERKERAMASKVQLACK